MLKPPADPCFDEPIAIIGMACRLPGAANLDQYWQLLGTGSSAVTELPAERFNERLYFDPAKGVRGKSYSKLAALLADRKFDRVSCPIPSSLESAVDNAHLLMCEVAAAACGHAGLDPFDLPLRNTGVYIGHAQGSDLSGDLTFSDCVEEAAELLREVPEFAALAASAQDAIVQELVAAAREGMPTRSADSPDVSISMVAGTISKAFGLTGPYVALNAACASSLQAIQFAARALQSGRVDMAIAGGASDCKEGSMVLFSHAQTLSSKGSCPFDNDADGLIISEGYVAIVLKTLRRALADGDPIQAVIPGIGCSSDGKGKSLWAPRKEGQVKAIQRAYSASLDIGTLQFIEAHATSTSLGDATELAALSEVLVGKLPAVRKIPVSSVKANIGHSLEAAGIAGLIKTVLCMQHRTIVAAINIQTLNSKIDWSAAPIYVPLKNEEWPEQTGGLPRRAAVNAFGIGGLNMHVVLEEFTEARRPELAARYPSPPKSGPAARDDERDIAVIGRGCIFAGAGDAKRFWDLLEHGRDPKRQAPPGRWRNDLARSRPPSDPSHVPTSLGGYVTDFAYDWKRHKVPPIQVQQADPLQFMLLDATEQALADAGYDRRDFDRTRTAVLVGTESGGDFGTQLCVSLRLPQLEEIIQRLLAKRGIHGQEANTIAEAFSGRLLKHWPALVDESGSFSTSTLASRITKTMNLMGGAAAIDAGDASSAVALAIGVDLLLAGDCDQLICAGGQRCMNLPKYKVMHLAGALSTAETPPSPFDAAAKGTVPGEGVGVVLLKRLADARRDGDPIHAIIRGVGLAHASEPGQAWTLAIERAKADTGANNVELTLIETGGSGIAGVDEAHVRAIGSVYGNQPPSAPLILGTVVGQIGHTAGASAMASLIAATLMIEHGSAPASFGFASPLPCIAEQSKVLRMAKGSQPLGADGEGRRFAAVDSFNKGQACRIILERGEKVVMRQSNSRSGENGAAASSISATPKVDAMASNIIFWRLGLAAPNQLNSKLRAALANPSAAFSAAKASRFSTADKARLIIVAASAEQFAEQLQTVFKHSDASGLVAGATTALERHGCYYRETPSRAPRVAFLFPGQGSQYAGMLRELVRDVPAASAFAQTLEEILVRHGYPTFAQMAWERPEQLGVDIWITQLAMLTADLIVHAAVKSLGIEPQLVAGHSLGEYAALGAAGAWDPEGVILALRARFLAIQATPSARGALMAVAAPASAIEPLASKLTERVYIANYNAPQQTIVGGKTTSLEILAKLLKAHNHPAQMLAVPCPYHTPLMHGAGTLLRRSLDALVVRPPRTPVLSSVTNRYVAEPGDIRANLAAQLTSPVRYIELVERIAGEESTVFVEVGPQRTLTNLHQQILADRNATAAIGTQVTAPRQQSQLLACDHPKRPGVEQLLHLRAILECLGVIGPEAISNHVNSTHVSAESPRIKGQMILVDATEKRRDKMRHASAHSNGNVVEPAITRRPLSEVAALPALQEPAWHEQPEISAARQRIIQPSQLAGFSAPPSASAPTQVESSVPAATVASQDGRSAELEKFLINFVVEQTGYPPEAIDLDSDLEADLGIDSIKKAQLFAELSEYFDARPSEGLTLDDFPTLRHALNFLTKAPAKTELPTPVQLPSPASPRAPTESIRAIKASFATGVVSAASTSVVTQASVRQPVATMPSVATISMNSAQLLTADPQSPATASTPELEKFLINFVIEQTGYPAEAVDLDSDLEADLGIDSIKKAQLFAELSEYFDARPAEGMTLDDFPTLRHVLDFLATADAKKKAPGARNDSPEAVPITSEPESAKPPQSAARTRPPAASESAASLPVMRLDGTPYQMGLAHGQQQANAIRRLLRRFADLADSDFADVPLADGPAAERRARFTPDELDELRGMSDAVQVPLDNLLAINLAIDADRGAAASHMASLLGNPERLVHAAAYHAPWPAALSECLTPVVSLRCPWNGYPHVSFSFAGAVGSLAGVNCHGLAVTVAGHPSSPCRTHSQIALQMLAKACDIDAAASIRADFATPEMISIHVSHAPSRAVRHFGSSTNQSGYLSESILHEIGKLFSLNVVTEKAPSDGERVAQSGNEPILFMLDPAHDALCIRNSRGGLSRLSLSTLWPPASTWPSKQEASQESSVLDGLESTAGQQTHRFVMKMKKAPLPASTPEMPPLAGAVLVVGDNAAADALSDRLQAAGAAVHRMQHLGAIEPVVAELERLWRLGPIPHLFLMIDRDLEPLDLHDESSWNERRYRSIDVPFFLTQRWVQLAGEAKLLPCCTLVVATALGGDFGFSGELNSPLGAALAGMIKAIYIEIVYLAGNQGMRVKAIDFPDDEPAERLAACVCREMAGQTVDYEIGYVNGERFLPCGYPQPAPPPRPQAIRRGGTWVFTGGASGITALCAFELGSRFDLKLHLIGRSPRPSIDPAWRNLRDEALKSLKTTVMREARQAGRNMDDAWKRVEHELEIDRCLREFADAGLDFTYHACDVADGAALAGVLESIRNSSGPIEGVVHGAGVEWACRFERKQRDHVLATVAAKVDGAVNLMRLTWSDPIRHFVGFGSVAGRLGSNGQVDYATSSDLLCKLTAWYGSARPGVHAVGFHWHPWSEVGMAARPETTLAMKKRGGPELMPRREGIRHFLRELLGQEQTPEILITNLEYHGRFYKLDELPQSAAMATDPSAWAPWPAPPIAMRHRLATIPAPLPPTSDPIPKFDGPVWILGNNRSAIALGQRLAAAGAVVHGLPVNDSPEQTIAEIEALFNHQPPRHLFLMSGRDEASIELLDQAGWRRRRALRVTTPYLAVQRLYQLRRQARDHTPIAVTAVTGLGGDFGLSGNFSEPEGGMLCGLLKSLFIEDSRLERSEGRFKIIDAPLDEPVERLVDNMLLELAADDTHLEVGWLGGRRVLVRSVLQAVESLPKQREQPSGAWVITGGARGITAAAAMELGRRFGVKLHLIGRSPVPLADALWRDVSADRLAEIKAQIVRQAVAEGRPVEAAWEVVRADLEIDQTLKRFAAAGLQAKYHSCDLADWPRLAEILDQIRRTDGPIRGVVHGAGYGKSGRFDTRPLESVERTLAGKLDGAVAMMALTWRDPIEYWIGFGSLSGRFGGNGLTDYAGANDMLAKLVDWYRARRPDSHACCFHWQSWNDIGMAMLGDSAAGTKTVLKMEFLSPQEGIEHFCREIEAGLPTGEVLITDGFFERLFHPRTVEESENEIAVSSGNRRAPDLMNGCAGSLPLVVSDRPRENAPGRFADIVFDPAADPFLLDHRFREKPFLPAVVALEAMAEAAALHAGKPVAKLRDIEFVTGLRFLTSSTIPVRVMTERSADGGIECRLLSDFVNRTGATLQRDRLHVRCLADAGVTPESGGRGVIAPPSVWQPFRYPSDSPMLHGPSLQSLVAVAFDGHRAWGQATALPLAALGGVNRKTAWSVPATVLDAAFYVCGLYVWFHVEPSAALPAGIGEIRLGRLPRDHEQCLVNAEFCGMEGRTAAFDFTVSGDDGAMIARVSRFRCQLLGSVQ